MNAGGVPNTCKSSGSMLLTIFSSSFETGLAILFTKLRLRSDGKTEEGKVRSDGERRTAE
jgi:hypothetical protein